ncbi:concanavalin A-like lectin/glucanase domain-containing protein [Clohesyomyces aquaticus]|uniref:Concanavalin A-like lectin/glucanase domain-containing protein n=1 Tax=Clohesyomyces aquaticus TaxID=1231657 RepID=A0A1Y1YKL6_9PLEO|nr:concanavalin A-like lectin/glucanase domain-containing protein [Clohesyomyces aquaticus]
MHSLYRLFATLPLTSVVFPVTASPVYLLSHFTSRDPTNGFVKYLDQEEAQSQGLVSVSGSTAPGGRASVRLEGRKRYNHELFVLDLAHIPSSTCGAWPSWWLYGPGKTWPENGEIDIIEGIHTNAINTMSLYTSNGCSISGSDLLDKVITKNCFIHAPAGGGDYAMEWTSSSIKIWSFSRSTTPSDIGGNSPNPKNWGIPQANFAGECNIERHLPICSSFLIPHFVGTGLEANGMATRLANTLAEYVEKDPAAFSESYWRINSLRVFQQ